jgi:hypothetical protein
MKLQRTAIGWLPNQTMTAFGFASFIESKNYLFGSFLLFLCFIYFILIITIIFLNKKNYTAFRRKLIKINSIDMKI